MTTVIGLRAAGISAPVSFGFAGPEGYSFEEAVNALDGVREILDRGDDLAVTEHELNQVFDLIKDLDPEELEYVFGNLSDEQLRRLFHNVHSSGFWSNDWNDLDSADYVMIFIPGMNTDLGDYINGGHDYATNLYTAANSNPEVNVAIISWMDYMQYYVQLRFTSEVSRR